MIRLLSALVTTAALAAAAADYPTKPITLIVPFPPGGSNDILARLLQKDLSDALKQPIIIDNRPGAGGNIGAAVVARAEPDGHTICIVSSTFISNAAIQANIPYDAIKGFAPIGLIARSPLVVTVSNELAAKTPQQLIELLKKNPGKYNYGSSGTGSLSHLSMELIKARAGDLQVVHVPYKGTAPAIADVIGNSTQVLIASAPALMPQVRGGRIRGIAVTSLARSAVAPELPPLADAIPGYEYLTWWGLLAPARTPAAVIQKLNAALNQVLEAPAAKEGLMREGAEAAPGPPADFAALMAQDLERIKALARQQKIEVD